MKPHRTFFQGEDKIRNDICHGKDSMNILKWNTHVAITLSKNEKNIFWMKMSHITNLGDTKATLSWDKIKHNKNVLVSL